MVMRCVNAYITSLITVFMECGCRSRGGMNLLENVNHDTVGLIISSGSPLAVVQTAYIPVRENVPQFR
eukprot:7623250-Ditylum_brightwellii.AAC.1